jgi:hypothetical protein
VPLPGRQWRWVTRTFLLSTSCWMFLRLSTCRLLGRSKVAFMLLLTFLRSRLWLLGRLSVFIGGISSSLGKGNVISKDKRNSTLLLFIFLTGICWSVPFPRLISTYWHLLESPFSSSDFYSLASIGESLFFRRTKGVEHSCLVY